MYQPWYTVPPKRDLRFASIYGMRYEFCYCAVTPLCPLRLSLVLRPEIGQSINLRHINYFEPVRFEESGEILTINFNINF